MTVFRVKVLPQQHYDQPHREVSVCVVEGDALRGCGVVRMRPDEARAFAASFDELALSREILSEDRLSQLAISDDIAGLRMLYLTARGRATEGTT
jgi:hypothetical protein